MTPDRWQVLRSVYEALQVLPPAERARALTGYSLDPELRAELEKVLKAGETEDAFIDEPLGGILREWFPGPVSSSVFETGDILADRFEIQRILGSGGMGTVYSALDRELGEVVALKLIHQDLAADPSNAARFKRELQLARKITHPNVCRLFDIFHHEDSLRPATFLTMELLRGATLSESLKSGVRFSEERARSIALQICSGLAAAHDAGIVHRDFKPSNIILLDVDGPVRPVITDFGLARLIRTDAEDGLTKANFIAGTPEYMAPEQLTGGSVTAATDVYALGLVLYELLAGEPPFPAESAMEAILKRARSPVPSVRKRRPRLAHSWDLTIQRCLQYEHGGRFQNAREVIGALQRRYLPGRWKVRWLVPKTISAWVLYSGLIGAAAVYFASSRNSRPPRIEKAISEAKHAIAEGAYLRASAQLERLLAESPRLPVAYAYLADAYDEMDMAGKARDTLLKGLDLARDDGSLSRADRLLLEAIHRRLVGEVAGAVQSFRDLSASADTPVRAEALIFLARALDRAGQTESAVAALRDASRMDADDAAVPLRLAGLHVRQRSYKAAEAALTEAESLNRTRGNFEGVADVMLLRGTVYSAEERLSEAVAELRRALQLARATGNLQAEIRTLLQLAVVSRKTGDSREAEEETRGASNLARKHDLDTLLLDALFTEAGVQLAAQQYAQAQASYEQARDIARRSRNEARIARAELSLASVFVRTGEPVRAEAAIQSALPFYQRGKYERGLASAKALLGQIKLLRCEYKEAAVQFREELEASARASDVEQNTTARDNLATALTESGEIPQALDHYAQAARANAVAGKFIHQVYDLLNIADLLTRVGRLAEADMRLQEVTRMIAQRRLGMAELKSRIAYLRAQRFLAAGLSAKALAEVRAVLADKGAGTDRIQEAYLAGCSTAARSRIIFAGSGECQHILRSAESNGLGQLAAKAKLTNAEMLLEEGKLAAAEKMGEGAHAALSACGCTETIWRASATQAIIASRSHQTPTGYSDAMTRELTEFRLKIGEQNFRTYIQRADVSRLLVQTNGAKN